jgi:hypothetical protein
VAAATPSPRTPVTQTADPSLTVADELSKKSFAIIFLSKKKRGFPLPYIR